MLHFYVVYVYRITQLFLPFVGYEAIVFRFAVTVSGKEAEVIVVSGGGGGYKHIVFEDHN